MNPDTVLLVEDDVEARTTLAQILQFEGFKVAEVGNGAEALGYLSRPELPCLLVLDVRMPVMDGYMFRAAMLRDPRLARIPLVVLTAAEPSAAANLSALRVFRKPVDVRALLGVIRQHC